MAAQSWQSFYDFWDSSNFYCEFCQGPIEPEYLDSPSSHYGEMQWVVTYFCNNPECPGEVVYCPLCMERIHWDQGEALVCPCEYLG